jgi:uncharacterized protein YdhG (YjbR/CyaY superfamily)
MSTTSGKARDARTSSVGPFSPAVVSAVADQLTGFSLSEGTIRFTAETPLPDRVIEHIVRLRLAEITGA